MDCRVEKVNGSERMLFSWQGFDECDEASGMRWAEVNEKKMKGWIQFHMADDPGFTAARK